MSYRAEKSRHYRKNGSGYYQPRWKQQSDRPEDEPSTPPPPLGAMIKELQVTDLDERRKKFIDSEAASITSSETVTSYNWMHASPDGPYQPTIMIPGKPPLWTPHTGPQAPQLSEDRGTFFRDQNSARFPQHPIQPAVMACLQENEDAIKNVDVFACASTVSNLLRFIRGVDRPFRMLVERIGKTVFFIRRENSPTETIPGVRGFGHAFPEAYTTWEHDVRGSATHQRLVKYRFGELNFVVRFEADGYIRPPGSTDRVKSRTSPTKEDNEQGETTDSSVDGLVQGMRQQWATTVATISASDPNRETHLEIKNGGESVDQDCLFDLKTRSIKTKGHKDHFAEEVPRFWVNRIPNFILAFHTRGMFEKENIQIIDVRRKVDQWEQDHQLELTRLAALVNDLVLLSKDEKFEICYNPTNKPGKLEIRKQLPDAGEALSDDVRAQWEGRRDCESEFEVEGEFVRGFSDVEDGNEDDDGDYYYTRQDFGDSDSDNLDYTACSASDCGYCGKCPY